ncbi:MAG: adenylyl-sulfate kinase [Thermoleophilia bacterium]|nr:adenylyl-sulfate kinase [Thermoleophilia bacterium]
MPRAVASADAVLAAVLKRREALGRTTTVAVSGVDCAGKSTLAGWLRERLDERGAPVVVLAGDDFLRPRAERRANADQALGYYRESFDYGALFREVLLPARRGKRVDVRLQVADERDRPRERRVVVEPGSIVLAEGVFLLAGARRSAFDLAVWIEIALDDALARARRRPFDLARYGGADGVEREYPRRFLAGQRLHLEFDRPGARADVVVSAEHLPAPPGISATA